jgi:hypothetical protein
MLTNSIEYIQYKIDAEHQGNFIKAISKASKILFFYADCVSFDLNQCEEDRTVFFWRIKWISKENYLNGFKKSKDYEFLNLIMDPYTPNIQKKNHYSRICMIL